MIWKDSLKLGVAEVDKQHRELFKRFNDFLQVVRGKKEAAAKEDKIKETLEFLGEYVNVHFASEEKIQQKHGYPGYEEHHQIHEEFKAEVAEFKQEFLETGYEEDFVQEFTGRVLSWLVNHVAAEDQKIADYIEDNVEQKEEIITEQEEYISPVFKAAEQTFSSMFQREINKEESQQLERIVTSKVTASIGVTGDLTGNIIFSFPEAMVLDLVEEMSGMELNDIDKFATSAVGEIANIISGKAMTNLNEFDYECNIAPPQVMVGKDKKISMEPENIILLPLNTDQYEFEVNILLAEN